MTGVELLQNGIGRTLGFLGRAGAMISITLLSRAEDEPEYQIHIDTGVSILLNGVAYTSSAEINDDHAVGVSSRSKSGGSAGIRRRIPAGKAFL